MSRLIFEDGDPGNLPAILHPRTGQKLPPEHPVVMEAARLYTTLTTLEQRRSWHAVLCLNSRKSEDLLLFQQVVKLIEPAIKLMPNEES